MKLLFATAPIRGTATALALAFVLATIGSLTLSVLDTWELVDLERSKRTVRRYARALAGFVLSGGAALGSFSVGSGSLSAWTVFAPASACFVALTLVVGRAATSSRAKRKRATGDESEGSVDE